MKHSDLALLAQSAYTRAPEWEAPLHIRACLDMIDGSPVVSVPGTDPTNVLDLLRDADCDAVWVKGLGFCHDGFQATANALWPKVKDTLFAGKTEPIPSITFTGHSLGGAVAIMLAALCARDDCAKTINLVTFGAPRVGAQMLAARLLGVKKTLYRFGADPVPQVPWLLLWQLPPVVCMHPASLTKIGNPGFPLIVGNHLITHYIAALEEAGL